MKRDYRSIEGAIEHMRTAKRTRGQAWLTADECDAVLKRIAEMTCDKCGDRCEGEVVARYCDECVEVRGG